jgi:hypothetical protein
LIQQSSDFDKEFVSNIGCFQTQCFGQLRVELKKGNLRGPDGQHARTPETA